jgi:bifunctional DNA-binding transcriptional regulator/antitoxin component of YhaV-PrlF toxin-antitoxin module
VLTTTTRIGPKYQVVIPKKLRTAAKLEVGDFLEARLDPEERAVVLTPKKSVVDRNSYVEKDIALAEAAVKAGRVLGPFETMTQVRRALTTYKAVATKKQKGKPNARAVGSRHARTVR